MLTCDRTVQNQILSYRLTHAHTNSHRLTRTHTDSHRFTQTQRDSHALTETYTEKCGPMRASGPDSQSHCLPRTGTRALARNGTGIERHGRPAGWRAWSTFAKQIPNHRTNTIAHAHKQLHARDTTERNPISWLGRAHNTNLGCMIILRTKWSTDTCAYKTSRWLIRGIVGGENYVGLTQTHT